MIQYHPLKGQRKKQNKEQHQQAWPSSFHVKCEKGHM